MFVVVVVVVVVVVILVVVDVLECLFVFVMFMFAACTFSDEQGGTFMGAVWCIFPFLQLYCFCQLQLSSIIDPSFFFFYK